MEEGVSYSNSGIVRVCGVKFPPAPYYTALTSPKDRGNFNIRPRHTIRYGTLQRRQRSSRSRCLDVHTWIHDRAHPRSSPLRVIRSSASLLDDHATAIDFHCHRCVLKQHHCFDYLPIPGRIWWVWGLSCRCRYESQSFNSCAWLTILKELSRMFGTHMLKVEQHSSLSWLLSSAPHSAL